ncbi:MAG: amidohydrolase family protein, partial [Herpetosiphon sp.]|nr:amidohydrolase family protein [Herpetosiphon sp.]
MHVDLFITNIARLLTCSAAHGALRGAALREAQIIENAAIAIMDGRIVALGTTEHLHDYTAITVVNATGLIAMPGFVDPHTHVCYAGDRADEFALRIAGATYQELMAAGGGIMSTVRATRAASRAELVAQTRTRLDRMLKHGTTTVEIKTGYGLDVAHEIAMLEALAELEQSHRISIVP